MNNSITFAYYVTKCAYFQNDVDPTEYVTILLLFSSSVWFKILRQDQSKGHLVKNG